MKLSKGLIKLARISPKEYRIAILKRNEILLEKLMMLKPYVEKETLITDIPSKVLERVKDMTFIGCPHCCGCTNCLWNKAFGNKAFMPCVYDNHFTDNDRMVRIHSNISVVYWNKSEEIEIAKKIGENYNYEDEENEDELEGIEKSNCIDKVQWERCIKYVKGHIQWAKLSCWGKDYCGTRITPLE